MLGKIRKFVLSELGVGLLACLSLAFVGAVAASRSTASEEVAPEAVSGLYGACGNYTSTGPGCSGCYPGTGYLSVGTITGTQGVNIAPYSCSYFWSSCGQYYWQSACSTGM